MKIKQFCEKTWNGIKAGWKFLKQWGWLLSLCELVFIILLLRWML